MNTPLEKWLVVPRRPARSLAPPQRRAVGRGGCRTGSMRPFPPSESGRVAPRWSPAATGQRARAAWSNDPAQHPPRPTARRPGEVLASEGADAIQVALDVIPRQESAMSETPKLLLQKDGPIGWIIFNQPEKRNAVSLEMWQLMPEYVHDLATDDAIRVVILRGAGDQAFVAGADISQFKERRRNM